MLIFVDLLLPEVCLGLLGLVGHREQGYLQAAQAQAETVQDEDVPTLMGGRQLLEVIRQLGKGIGRTVGDFDGVVFVLALYLKG